VAKESTTTFERNSEIYWFWLGGGRRAKKSFMGRGGKRGGKEKIADYWLEK